MSEFIVKPSVKIEDGKHTGEIKRIEYRDTPYKYTDIVVKLDEADVELKHGVPTNEAENSKMMKLIGNFRDIKIGDKIDPEKELVGKKVEFMTMKEKTDDGEFARIIDGSIKPIKAEGPEITDVTPKSGETTPATTR